MSRDRKDTNHARLRTFARTIGWWWRDQNRRAGFDALLAKHGRIVLAEVKRPGEELSLTENEQRTQDELKAQGITVEILTCEEDVIALERPHRRGSYDDRNGRRR